VDCLTPPEGGGVSTRSGRIDDAQDEAWHGRFLLVPFSYAYKKMNDLLGIFFGAVKSLSIFRQ
jgi:hypothetical protein